jgi:hypothetical protein
VATGSLAVVADRFIAVQFTPGLVGDVTVSMQALATIPADVSYMAAVMHVAALLPSCAYSRVDRDRPSVIKATVASFMMPPRWVSPHDRHCEGRGRVNLV